MTKMCVTPMTSALPRPIWSDPRRQAEIEQQADKLVQAALCMHIRHQIEATAPVDWEAGTRLLESEHPAVQRLGTLFLLQALAITTSPVREAAGHILCEMQSES